MATINYTDKVAVNPVTNEINQVTDANMNEIKSVVNMNAGLMLIKGANTLNVLTTIVTSAFGLNINNGAGTSFLMNNLRMILSGDIRVLPTGVTPTVGNALGYVDTNGTIGQVAVSGSIAPQKGTLTSGQPSIAVTGSPNNVSVFVSGAVLIEGTDYTYSSGTGNILFTGYTPFTGDSIEILKFN